MSTPRAFLHIGLPKTGTSYLQSVLRQGAPELARRGLAVLPNPAAGSVPSTRLALAVRGTAPHLREERADAVLDRFAQQVAETPGDLIVSQEQLCSASEARIPLLLDRLADHEPHIVITARNLARQVASGWQQRVKARSRIPYDQFLESLQAGDALGQDFLGFQDIAAIAERWGRSLPPEQVHIIVVPRRRTTDDQLLAAYFSVLGIDHEGLPPANAPNATLSLAAAEVLRRVNESLGDRLRDRRSGGDYSRNVRWHLVSRVLANIDGASPRLPRSMQSWCVDAAQRWVSDIKDRGYHVVGDLDDLLPQPSDFEDGATLHPAEADLAEVAIGSLAELMVLREAEVARMKELSGRVRELESQLEASRGNRVSRAVSGLRRSRLSGKGDGPGSLPR